MANLCWVIPSMIWVIPSMLPGYYSYVLGYYSYVLGYYSSVSGYYSYVSGTSLDVQEKTKNLPYRGLLWRGVLHTCWDASLLYLILVFCI